MRKKILVVSTFPPTHCGVGTYAQEHLGALKKEGHRVYTLSFDPTSSANFRYDSKSSLKLLRAFILFFTRDFDEVYLHFTNGLIWTRHKTWNGYINKILLMLWTLCLALRYRTVLVAHEILSDVLFRHSVYIHRFIYSSFSKIWVHTESEKQNFLKTFGTHFASKMEVIPHHRFFTPKFNGSKEDARRQIGIDLNKRVFLSIGFWIKTKGFEDAIEAISKLDASQNHLYVVGSLREDKDPALRYRKLLQERSKGLMHVTLIETHLSDEDFDRWIQAADAVVLPYTFIWSSGVAARCQVMRTPVLSRNHANLLDQLGSHARFFNNTEELRTLMQSTGPKISEAMPIQKVPGRKFLFIIGAFGKNVRGGAEGFVYQLATELSKNGADIEVWTTNSNDPVKRKVTSNEKDDEDLPFKIRRFPVNRNAERFFGIIHRFMQKRFLAQIPLLRKLWVDSNIYGYGMYEALVEEGERFDLIHLFHYLHGTSHRLSGVFPEKTLLHPFVHKESFLYNPVMVDLFAGVRGVTCNTPVCGQLAMSSHCGLTPKFYVPIGNGVERKVSVESSTQNSNYLVYIGRMVPDKNISLLLSWHERLLQENPNAPELICIGDGLLAKHSAFSHPKIHHKSWVDEEEKIRLLRNAKALVQLSLLESFSLVMMESWLEETPVIVHKDSPALMEHIRNSKSAGIAVGNYEDYKLAVQTLSDEKQRAKLGKLGKEYVEFHYNWKQVCSNYFSAVDSLLS